MLSPVNCQRAHRLPELAPGVDVTRIFDPSEDARASGFVGHIGERLGVVREQIRQDG